MQPGKKVIVIDLNVRVKNNISEENIGEYLQVLELDKDFLDMATKSWSIKEKKLTSPELKTCISKENHKSIFLMTMDTKILS